MPVEGGAEKGKEAPPAPSPLHELIPMPGWLGIEEAQVSLRDTSFLLNPSVAEIPAEENSPIPLSVSFSQGVSGLHGSVQYKQDNTFRCEISEGLAKGSGQGEKPWNLAGGVACSISGRLGGKDRFQAKGNVKTANLSASFRETPVNISDPLELSFDVALSVSQGLSASDIHLTGPGTEIRTKGDVNWAGGFQEINLKDLNAEIERWEPLMPLLPKGTELSGKLSLQAQTLSVKPSEGVTPETSADSFLTGLPPGITLQGLMARVSEGSFRLSTPEGLHADLSGAEVSLEQKQGKEWDGKVEIARVDLAQKPERKEGDPSKVDGNVDPDGIPRENPAGVSGAPPPEAAAEEPVYHYAGPLSVQCRWAEGEEDVLAILVIDLTRALCRYRNLLDKPPDVAMQAGIKARIKPGEINVAKAYLLFGEIELAARGSILDPADPSLEARLISNILPLDSLAGLSPFVSEHHLKGLLEIKKFELEGKIRALKETSTLQVRLAAKNLEYNRTAIKGLFAQAVYGDEILTLNPLILHPGKGVMESTFTADFSEARRAAGKHQYYGTLKVNNVELNKVITLAQPEYAGRAYGKLDVNLACRGSGFRWEEAVKNLEAKARVYLKGFTLAEGSGTGKGEGIAEKTDKMVAHLAGGDTAGIETASVATEEKRFLSKNNLSAILSLKDRIISTKNLAATYQGKVVEVKGDMDFTGRVNVKEGKIFFRKRMVPFRLICRIGKTSCLPAPDFKAMSLSAAKEVFGGLRTLSTGAKDVFKDVFF